MAQASPWSRADVDVVSATFLGLSPTREAIVRVRRADGAETVWAVALPNGPARPAPPTTAYTAVAAHDGTVDRGLSIDLEVTAPLGDRGRAALRASDGERIITLEQLPPPGPIPRLAQQWWVGRYAVVAVDRGAQRSLHVVDLDRARARLSDRAALEAYRAGDLRGAIALWQRAREQDATYGDAPYNAACAYAQAGALDLARQHLAQAVAIDGPRFRLLARLDPDLAGVATSTRSIDPSPSTR